jgi:hypothetical protein
VAFSIPRCSVLLSPLRARGVADPLHTTRKSPSRHVFIVMQVKSVST